MNAPLRTISFDTPAMRQHGHSVLTHCPTRDDVELQVRCDLAAIRDRATSGIARATESAGIILGEVARLATHAVYAQRTTSELMRIRIALTQAVDAARSIERVTRD